MAYRRRMGRTGERLSQAKGRETLEEKALNELIRKLPDTSVFRPTKKFYNTPEWEKEFSPSFRKYKDWRCEECGLRLPPNESKDQYYLDTHHKYGLQCQDYLEHFQALCHGCHAEQDNHEEMKKGEKYKKFMKRQKKEWRKCRSKTGLPS